MSVAIIGEKDHDWQPLVERLQSAGLNVLVNYPPGPEDLILFCIPASTGLAPETLEAFDICRGLIISRFAVLLYQSDRVDPKELGLVSDAAAEALLRVTGGEFEDCPRLRAEQTDLVEQLRQLMRAPGKRVSFGDGSRSVAEIVASKDGEFRKRPWWRCC